MSATALPPSRQQRRGLLLASAIVAGLLLFVIAGAVIIAMLTRPGSPSVQPSAATTPPGQGEALTADEKTVKAFILDNADDPKSVEFAAWGPVVSGDELRKLTAEVEARRAADPSRRDGDTGRDSVMEAAAAAVNSLVGVKYRANNRMGAKELHDEVWLVGKDGSTYSIGTGWVWVGGLKEELARPYGPVPPPDPQGKINHGNAVDAGAALREPIDPLVPRPHP